MATNIGGPRGPNATAGVSGVDAVAAEKPAAKAAGFQAMPGEQKVRASQLLSRGKLEEAATLIEPFDASLAATIRRTDETAVSLFAATRMA